MKTAEMRVYRGKFILLPGGEALENGVIHTRDGVIEKIGPYTGESIDVDIEGWITPGFVNAHCHLELSHLKNKIPQKTGLPGFIQAVQSQRNAGLDEITSAVEEFDRAMWESGISAVGDICNGTHSISTKKNSAIEYHNFVEVFSFDPSRAYDAIERGEGVLSEFIQSGLPHSSLTPHAPYSVSEKLFKLLLHHDSCYYAPVTIHNQETPGENELYQSGTGPIAEQLRRFGLDTSSFRPRGFNSLPSYLVHFSKCNKIQLVHNTYTVESDIDWALKYSTQTYWCTCPNANIYIEDRLPDYALWLQKGLKITIGTDSLASNWNLNMIDEMRQIQRSAPQVSTAEILRWGTENGADFLEKSHLGKLQVGTRPGLVAIYNTGPQGEFTADSFSKRLI